MTASDRYRMGGRGEREGMMGNDEKLKKILLPWTESDEYAKAKRTRLLVERICQIRGGDYRTDPYIQKLREYEARVLMFTSYPLGKGRAFVVSTEGACK